MAILACCLTLCCCTVSDPDEDSCSKPFSDVMLCYFAAFNNLATSNYMLGNLDALTNTGRGAWLPRINDRKALLMYIHTPDGYFTSSKPTPAYLLRLYADRTGRAVRDTIWSSDVETIASADALTEAVNYVVSNFDSERYGMVFSSHGTGWMPQGSYDTEPTGSEFYWDTLSKSRGRCSSFGHEWVQGKEYFIDLPEMAAALPIHLDYIVFDACLMGGIETAYELRNCADVIGFSQCEVMGSGFIYSRMADRLLRRTPADVQAVMEDVFSYYDGQSGSSRTSVVSLVDCSKVEAIAEACAPLFGKYADKIAKVDPDDVQGYFSSDYHWFYDLEDILVKSGVSDSELSGLRQALEDCMIYKAATPKILGSVTVSTHCGFSMYLPCNGSDNLDEFYRTLAWNKATGLVK